jgi:3D (Asp-Asp-Asp) domain-containing protein
MLTDSKGNIITSSKGGFLFRVAQEPPPPPPPTSLILDQVTGAIHAYSNARLLRSAYSGNLIEVRRSSDNTATGIGVSADELDQSALTAFTGGGNGFTRTKYDQVGSRNMVQTTNANQPQIVVSGSVVAVSGKPYAQYNGSSTALETGSATPVLDKDSTVFVVFESQSGVSVQGVFEDVNLSSFNQRVIFFSDTRTTIFRHSNYAPDATANFIDFSSQQPTSTKRVLSLRRTGNLVEGFAEGTKIGDITSSAGFSVNTVLELGRQLAGPFYFGGKIAELLIWNRALTSGEMTTVTNNIKSFYSIT